MLFIWGKTLGCRYCYFDITGEETKVQDLLWSLPRSSRVGIKPVLTPHDIYLQKLSLSTLPQISHF